MSDAETSIRVLIARHPDPRRTPPPGLTATHPRALALPRPCNCQNGVCRGAVEAGEHCKAHMADTLEIS